MNPFARTCVVSGVLLAGLLAGLLAPRAAQAWAPPRPPGPLVVEDHPVDKGDQVDLRFKLSPDDVLPEKPAPAAPAAEPSAPGPPGVYIISKAQEYGGLYKEVDRVEATARARQTGELQVTVGKCRRNEPFFFRVKFRNAAGEESPFVETAEPVVPLRQWFDLERFGLGVNLAVICGAVLVFIALARSGRTLRVRKIAGLDAIDEAVGRATEMGRPCLFVPGIQDMNDIQTIAGITILSRVAKTAAEYDSRIEVPTSRSLVMTAARETVQAAFLAAGRPDAYNEDLIYYVTDEQFGYVAYLSGLMVRQKPAACFYLGSFFAESLILAETGNAVGAIQIAGTAQPSQLPFFVAACDYTLIGEELFAASAYLSGEPDQLGSLKGQDVGKLIAAALIVVCCLALTFASVAGHQGSAVAASFFQGLVDFVNNHLLK